MSSKGGGGSTIVGYRYYMSIHMGLCRGPINELHTIRVGDLQAFSQDISGSNQFININQPNLFGGDDKEGGIKGTAYVALGDGAQTIPSSITSKLTGLQSAWRGVTTVFYYGQVCSNNPYPKSWKFRVRRYSAGWDGGDAWYADKVLIVMNGSTATIDFSGLPLNNETITINNVVITFKTATPTGLQVLIGDDAIATAQNLIGLINLNKTTLLCSASGDAATVSLTGQDSAVTVADNATNVEVSSSGNIYAMNPAHIIYECATNRAWGRGLPPAFIDDAAFRAAADTLYAEEFGLCIRWNREEDIDKFVQTIINHIGGAIYIDRTTGLLTLKLIRDDYNVDDLAIFNFNSGLLDITEDSSSSTDTSYNEVVVTWHDPITDEDGQVRVHDLASIQSLGCTISTTVEYMGCPTSQLALRLAQRDVEMQSRDLRRLTVKVDRAGWNIAPGSVFRIQASSRGINDMVLRAGKIEDSPLNDGTITISAVQDIFSLPDASFIGVENSTWEPPNRNARVIAVRRIEEMTWRDLSANLTTADLNTVEPDSGAIKTFAKQPTDQATDYLVDTAAGSEAFAERGTSGFEPTHLLTAGIGLYDTTIAFDTVDSLINTETVDIPSAALIGDEYVRVDSIDLSAGTATIARGIIDTIPAEHLSGIRVWFENGLPGGDGREYVTSEIVHVKLLTRTNSETLSETSAPTDDITIGGRQGRPYPPGDVRVNGVRYGEVTAADVPTDIELTWAHRDRIAEGDFLLEHGAASTGPEAGTTYTVRIYDGMTLLREITGITGTSYTYDSATIIADGDISVVTFELESVRDGFISWQHYHFDVPRDVGFDAGFDDDFDGGL